MDIHNVLGLVPIWALIALAIAVFSKSPLRAAINALCFFAGVLVLYCLCSVWLAGFMLDRSYLMIWVLLSLAAFPLGYAVWYARGKGIVAVILSAAVIAYYLYAAFFYDAIFSYFFLSSYGIWDIAFAVIAVLILYVDLKQTLISIAVAIALTYLIDLTGMYIPYIF